MEHSTEARNVSLTFLTLQHIRRIPLDLKNSLKLEISNEFTGSTGRVDYASTRRGERYMSAEVLQIVPRIERGESSGAKIIGGKEEVSREDE